MKITRVITIKIVNNDTSSEEVHEEEAIEAGVAAGSTPIKININSSPKAFKVWINNNNGNNSSKSCINNRSCISSKCRWGKVLEDNSR